MKIEDKKVPPNSSEFKINRLLQLQKSNYSNLEDFPVTQRFKDVYNKLVQKSQMHSNDLFEKKYVDNLLIDIQQLLQSEKQKLLLKQDEQFQCYHLVSAKKARPKNQNQSLPQVTQKYIDLPPQLSRSILKKPFHQQFQPHSERRIRQLQPLQHQREFQDKFNSLSKIQDNQNITLLANKQAKLFERNSKLHTYLYEQNQKDIHFLLQKLKKQKIQAKNSMVLKSAGVIQQQSYPKRIKKVTILE